MAIFNMCNRYDFVSNGRVVYKGAQFTEYEEVEQPKPEEPEEKKFNGSSLTGKVLGAVVAAGCVASAFGLVAAWGVSAAFSGGAAFAAAPLVWQGFAFLMAAAPIALGAGSAISEQCNQDMASQKDGEWGTYAKLGIGDPVVVGAQDVVIGLAVGSALAGAGRLMGKIIKPRFLKVKIAVQADTPAAKLADELRSLPASQRPNTVAVIKTRDGTLISGKNQGGITNPEIDAAMKKAGINEFKGECAEMNALASAKNQGINLEGAEISTANVRGSNSASKLHGAHKTPCSTCDPVLEELKITVIKGE